MVEELPRLKGPLLVEREEEVDPAAVAPVPEAAGPAMAGGEAMAHLAALAGRRGSGLGRVAAWVFGSLFSFVLTVTAWDFVTGLMAANPLLGWLAMALTLAALAVAVVILLQEALAFSRMGRLDRLRTEAGRAEATGDVAAARAVVARLASLYAGRGELAQGAERLARRQGEVMDADALLVLAEETLVQPLDRAALAAVEAASRRVAMVTALVPLALADVVTALVVNIRMIRTVAEIYGGRSGALGSWQLLRRVFVSLAATGALALTDDLMGSFAGGGVLSKLSRRFGEGLVNGALTARVGLAAMDLCRPLPWLSERRPGVSATVTRALAGLFGREG